VTGYSWLSSFFSDIGSFFRSIFSSPIVRAIVQIAIAAILTPIFAGAVYIAAAASTAIVTGLSGGKLGDVLKAAAIAGATAFAFWEVGNVTGAQATTFGTPNYLANVAGHAAVGCLSAVASGGQCGPGALSGAAGSVAAPLVVDAFPNAQSDLGQRLEGSAVSGVVGGLASVAGGGKFADGAVTAAFGYLFNDSDHPNNQLTSGWGGGFDPDQWQLVGTTTGDPLTFTAGNLIGVLASSSAGPLPTNQFWFSVNALPLDQYGNLIPSMPAEYEAPTLYSSGLTGFGNTNPFTFQALQPGIVPATGYRWTVGIPPQQDAHGNYDFDTIRVYIPKVPTQ
jgi:hypothetical protein